MLYFLESLRQKIIEIRGWKRNCLALSFGMLGVLALPPFLFLPLILVSLVVFNWILDGILVKISDHSKAFVFFQSFLTGWCFGLGFFLGGLYWVYNSFFVDPDKFAWLSPFAVLFLSSGMAVYIGFTASFACIFSRPGISRLVNICIFWVIFE
ncbi:MAG: Apolipoprotein N-acyltransferase, partial [Alphaproteobacteria bacterium MarineAlpha3_Bin7]